MGGDPIQESAFGRRCSLFTLASRLNRRCRWVCMYVYIYSSDMDIYKNYIVIMKIIIYSVEISSPIGTISNSEVVNLQL